MTVLTLLNTFLDCVCYSECCCVVWSELQNVFQHIGLNFGALSNQEILHLFFNGVDHANYVL